MSRLRGVAKLLALVVANAVFFGVIVVSSVGLVWLARFGRTGRGDPAWRTGVFHAWGKTMARLLGMRVTTGGNHPRPPFVLVSNHLGYVDVVLLASELRCVFVSKAEVRDWPVVGRLCSSVDTLFIRREQKREIPRVMTEMERVLASGRGIVLFPEGTSSPGDDVLRFRPSLLESAARTGRPVHYACLAYRTPAGSPAARDAVCWWGKMPFVSHVFGLLSLPGFEARIEFGDQPIVERERKALTQRLQREVERQFRTVIWVRSAERDRARKENR
ncbi:MAG TPA: lysophospholipid acyltransferase family protein [Candidatus Polarisedimenticolaceae bacterium]|nr:lysophospholipid acyltransferase family protein [Candidatus Polarisedimenticolaceae bacterium]